MTRKEMKKAARKSLKQHYIMYVAICLIIAFLGGESSASLDVVKTYSSENTEADGASGGMVVKRTGAVEVFDNLIEGNEEKGKELADKLEKKEEHSSRNPILGRSRGVLAQLVNAVTSGSIFVTILTAVNSMTGSENIAILFLIIGSLILMFSFWFFLTNMFGVVARRIFLEGRCYEELPIQRFMFLLRVKKWVKVSWTMFVTFVFQVLWSLTIIGGIIKRYSYYMVPYIAAENPDVKALEAVTLSRNMMNGHKWECFVYELSFFWWNILSAVTVGLSGIFYSNPYKSAAFSEYYVWLRSLAKENQIKGAGLMNDRYLFEKPETEIIQKAYGDVIKIMNEPVKELKQLKGVRGLLADWLGVVLLNSREEKEYEESQAEHIRIYALTRCVEGKTYPDRLSPIPEVMKRKKVENLHYMRHYSICSLILLFFIFSFIGWLWEVSLHLISDGVFVNRGVLHGPWLPIYGSGGILIVTVLKKLRKNPVLEFAGIVILCGIVEYGTSYYLEMAHHGEKWWDYSGYFLNLNGRICAEGLLVFGIGGIAIVYILAPLLDNVIKRIHLKLLIPACVVLLILFAGDQVYSGKHPNTGKGITDYQSRLHHYDTAWVIANI